MNFKKKVALVNFWNSSPFRIYGYQVPFLILDLKEGDFVIVPTSSGKSVARVSLIVPEKDFIKNNPKVILKSILKKINL